MYPTVGQTTTRCFEFWTWYSQGDIPSSKDCSQNGDTYSCSVSVNFCQSNSSSCAYGRVWDSVHNSCYSCPPGKFAANFSDCEDCPAGKYSNLPAMTQCKSCFNWSYSPAGSSSCNSCPIGKSCTSTTCDRVSACSSNTCFSSGAVNVGTFDDKSYFVFTSPRTFYEAISTCQSLNGAELLQIDSFKAMRELIFSNLNAFHQGSFNEFWVNFRLSGSSWRKWDQSNSFWGPDYSDFISPLITNKTYLGYYCLSVATSESGLSFKPSRCMDELPFVCVMNSSICEFPSSCRLNNSQTLQLETNGSCAVCEGISNKQGLFGCITCPVNTYIVDDECLPCPGFSRSPTENSRICSCEERQVFTLSTCICEENFYGVPNASTNSLGCHPCPQNQHCPMNTTIPYVPPGFGRSTDDFRLFSACIPKEACVSTNFNLETLCESAYTGEYCGGCSENYYRSGTACVPCGAESLKFVAFFVILILFLIVVLRLSSYAGSIPHDIGITISALQLISLFPTISRSWPKSLLFVMDVSSFTNLNLAFSSPECAVKASYWTIYHIKMCIPLMTITLAFILSCFINFMSKSSKIVDVVKLIQIAQFVVIASCTMQILTLVQPLNCFERDDRLFYPYVDPTVRCFNGEWKLNVAWSSIYFIIYVGLVPGLLGAILCQKPNQLKISTSPLLARSFRSLVQPYRPECFHWKAVVIGRKIILSLFFQALGSVLSKSGQTLATMMAMFAFLLLEIVKMPNARHRDNVLSIS
eukprot:TRINITY_DN12147_c0_g1_i2.p1 TRINITY_DN12147_c0_g1~~TRINITY_DN12147_c0_g1_i2.p1  ORF type:complete len:753 (-),score=102.57 TRINITY_DN12147_c0_g1_i2:1411-3669(-)